MTEADGGGTLVSDLLQVKKLFANNHLSDVLFIFSADSGDSSTSDGGDKSSTAGDHLIPAHRLVLSLRSGAFQAALLRAKSSQVPGQVRFPLKIHVQDTPYRVFYSLLRFLYTNELGAEGEEGGRQRGREEFWQQLLQAAFAYLVPSLVDICVKRIAGFLELKALKTENNAIIRRLLVDESAPFFLLTDKVPLIFLASASGNGQHCEILIEQNAADVNLISQLKDGDKEITAEFGHQQTPLHIASRKGHSAVVELLLQHNAASNLPDEEGNTALHYASNIETVEVLLNSAFRTNANIPNRRGRTPLHIAAARGDVAVVAYLIRHGAEQDIVDDQGQNAFHHAAANGHTAVTLVLLHENEAAMAKAKNLVAISDQSSESNRTPGDTQSEDSQRQVKQIEDEAVNNAEENGVERSGFDINKEDLKGNTALHLAAMSPSERCQKMLQLLLENGSDPNRANWFGYTPLHLFCSHQNGPASLITAFIEHGANIHAQSLDGSTALHLAVGRGSQDVAVALVSAGAFVHLLDAAGRSVVDLVESTNQGSMLVPVLRNLSHPPDWVGDEQTTECSSCHTTFRLAMRKHHCRHCGRTVCYNCSSNKITIPKFQVSQMDTVSSVDSSPRHPVVHFSLVPSRASAELSPPVAMSSPGEAPPPAPASIAAENPSQVPSNGDEFFVTANLVGAALRCVVNPQWPCEALLGAAAESYHATFPDSEVPECNVVFHRKKQEFLVAGTPISECCASGDELELGVTVPTHAGARVDDTSSIAASSVSGVDSDGETSEFCVLFHKLPLGFTMKRGHDSSTEVGTIYPKSAATHFPRLAPGVTIVSIAGTPLEDMGLRQVHDLIKNAGLPLKIHFRGPEAAVSPSLSPDPAQQQVPPSQISAAIIPPPHPQQQGERRRGSFDRRSVRSNGSNGSGRSRNSRSGGRGRKKGGDSNQHQGADNQQKGDGSKTRIQATAHLDASESNQRSGPEDHDADHTSEAELVQQIEQLKVALLRKHEEAKQIARQLETGAPSSSNGGSKVRLTPEVLEAMDQKAGLPRRGTGAYASSNVSSVSGYSAQSMPVARAGNMRARSARAAALLANADNVSVSSYTSNSSNTSARRGSNRSPRGTALRNLNKRYNYMPQKYGASATGASEAGSTSLSSRGAVMSRARISRDSFITKSESPGVGYYDVQVKDRVKGGEIGDSDRSLPWC
ncbi:Ankyrin repeat-containing domain [Phytophthora cactorum]|nr:Ankyrin repeat-containing domain [Phytophthora cactorum]